MIVQNIPLNSLTPSPLNVRKTGASSGIEELAASIAAHGLLQNLQVRPSAKGRFEVIAGGRRLAALKSLAKHKRIAKDFDVPCHVLVDEDAGEISLAENVVRLAMHPADQFDAFHRLIEQGRGVEEIAARFGVSAAVVRQRLRLAAVSPRLIDLYRDDEMNLDQLMAFTVSDDHAAQEAAWFDQPTYNRHPRDIRSNLTSTLVEAGDRRVAFVGLETYLEAGGALNRDLFQPDHEGYLTDPALLDRLVAERLEREAEALRAEGWKWVVAVPRRTYADYQDYGRVHRTRAPLSDEAQNARDQLVATYEALVAEHDEEPTEEKAAILDGLWDQIEAIEDNGLAWRDEDRALAGAVISIGHNGDLEIDTGLVHPDDKLRPICDPGGSPSAKKSSGLSARLTETLTAERTAALRAAMIDNHKVALATLAHGITLPLFYRASEQGSCLDIRLVSRALRPSSEIIEQSGAQVFINTRHADWNLLLPEQVGDLFPWLLMQDMPLLIALIGFCTALGIDAVQANHDRPTADRFRHADQLAAALDLDMAQWWSPTKDSYLGMVPKTLILEAVSEAVSAQASENLSALKKDPLIDAAAEKLAGKGWLPILLRSPKPVDGTVAHAAIVAE